MPVEKFDSSAAKITTRNKHCNRPKKIDCAENREIRVHMSTNLSSSSGFKLQSSLTEEQRNLWSNQLFEVFPEELRALLKRLCEITVSECQRIATTKLFHLFSFNASI